MRAPLVLISIDGLSPSIYLDPGTPCGTLRRLALGGVFAEAAVPVFPTLSMTNHATIATGVHSDLHEIEGNTRFDPQRLDRWIEGESRDWYVNSSDIRAPTLWRIARAAGLSTALFRWPTTRGARADWIVPEVFRTRSTQPADWELLRTASTPELIEASLSDPGFAPPEGHHALDRWTADVACRVLGDHTPDLTMIHLTELDHETHENGGFSERTREAARSVESRVLDIVAAADPARTRVMVLGDHGFMDFSRRVHVNSLLAREGWIEAEGGSILSWDAIAHINCAVAPVYVRDPRLADRVIEILRRNSGESYTVIDRSELDLLRAYPGAIACVEAAPGSSLGRRLEGPLLEHIEGTRGEHGYRPLWQTMQAGLFAFGKGLARGTNLGTVRLLDIAPTAVALLGLALPEAEGRILPLAADRFPRYTAPRDTL